MGPGLVEIARLDRGDLPRPSLLGQSRPAEIFLPGARRGIEQSRRRRRNLRPLVEELDLEPSAAGTNAGHSSDLPPSGGGMADELISGLLEEFSSLVRQDQSLRRPLPQTSLHASAQKRKRIERELAGKLKVKCRSCEGFV